MIRVTVMAALLGLFAPSPKGELSREVSAIEAEIERGLEGLRVKDGAKPYRASVRLVRADLLGLDGSYGGIVTNVLERQSAGTVDVRVGSSERDNSGYFSATGSLQRFEVALDPAPPFTRKRLWLAMDASFRGASKTYGQKLTALSRLADKKQPADTGPAPDPVHRISGTGAAPNYDREGLSAMVASLSARFQSHPSIDNGDVHLQVLRSHEILVTSENVAVDWIHDRAVLAVVADRRAADGMQLDHGLAIHLQRIPSGDEQLLARGEALVDRVLRELDELAAAPMLDEDYDGPILFAGDAAAQLLASTIATQAAGNPAPLGETGRLVELEPAWQDRVGKGVMPAFIDVRDDPTARGFGSYTYDGQGFKAKPVTLVSGGKLQSLLMTRAPNEHLKASNGRARMTPALLVAPNVSNLTLSSRRRGLARARLERELLRRAREDGYDFAYVVETMRDGIVLGPVPRESADAYYGGAGKINLPLPARVFRIEPGGKRTLVRGAIFAPVSIRVLRRIRAVGNKPRSLAMRIPVGALGGFGTEVGMDGVLAQTVDVQVTTPDLVIDGFELLVERGEHERNPTLVHPLRRPNASWKTD